MVAWYPFDEPVTGPSANLATQNAAAWYAGTPPTPGPGKVANALYFDGLTNFIDSADSIVTNFGPSGPNLNISCGFLGNPGDFSTCQGNFSIDVWVNLTGPVDSAPADIVETIVDKRDATPVGYSFALYRDNSYSTNTYILLQLGDVAHSYTSYRSSALTPAQLTTGPGVWHHLAVTANRAIPGKQLKFYFDGQPWGTAALTQTGTLVNNQVLRIGANGPSNGPIYYFYGALDELEIYNRVLLPWEVNNIYNAQSSGKCKP
jgi:hypothetical protein